VREQNRVGSGRKRIREAVPRPGAQAIAQPGTRDIVLRDLTHRGRVENGRAKVREPAPEGHDVRAVAATDIDEELRVSKIEAADEHRVRLDRNALHRVLEDPLQPLVMGQPLVQGGFAPTELPKPHVGVGSNRLVEVKHRAVVDMVLPSHDIDDVLRCASDEEALRQSRVGVPRTALAQQAERRAPQQKDPNRLVGAIQGPGNLFPRHRPVLVHERKQVELDGGAQGLKEDVPTHDEIHLLVRTTEESALDPVKLNPVRDALQWIAGEPDHSHLPQPLVTGLLARVSAPPRWNDTFEEV
jgi:hypothetical protein